MLIEKPLQLKETERWRMVQTSDEDATHFIELCECEAGHETANEAFECYQTSLKVEKGLKKLKETFGIDESMVINLMFEMECQHNGIKPKDMLLILKQSYIETSLERRGVIKRSGALE